MTDRDLRDAAPDQIEGLIRAAEKLGAGLLEAGAIDQRKIFLELVSCIEVKPDRVRIQINTNKMSQRLGHQGQGENAADRINIDIPVSLKRRGIEKKIVLTDRSRRPARPDAKLIRAVAQGRLWFAQLKSGEVRTAKEIATRNGTDFGNVTRTMQLAFLAPDIVEAILDGRQPPELTAFRLKRVRNLSASWAEQRDMLGFAG